MYGEEHESDYEEGDSEIFNPSFKPSYVVVAIDTHPCMFKKNENGKMPFRMCLEALAEVMEILIFRKDTRSWSPFAVVLAGAATPLVSFSQSVLDTIKLLQEKCKLTDADLIKQYQRKSVNNLSSFFLTCKKVFHEIKSVFYKRTLIYLSNDDKPVTDKAARFTALNEIKTFAASHIEFQIIPTIQDFKYNFFYNELFSIVGNPNREEICIDTEGLTEKLTSLINVDVYEHKVLFYPFPDDYERFLKCKRFTFLKNPTLYSYYTTKDGKRVINTSVPSDEPETFKIRNIREEAAKDNVFFDPLEKESLLDNLTPKGLILAYVGDRQIGFGHMPSSNHLIKKDPTEELPYFSKFWDHCVASKKVLVCLSKTKQPDKPRYAELIPVSVNGQQMFLEKRLTYGNEILLPFKLNYPEEDADDKRKQLIEQLVDKLTFDFDPKMLPDISLQKKKAYMKAKLLETTCSEPVNDIQVDSAVLDDVIQDIVSEIQEKFTLVDNRRKRKAPVPYSKKNKRGK